MNRSMKSNITSLEQMVEKGELVYDFDTTSVKSVNYEKTRIGRVLKEYSGCFEELLLNREDSHLWLRCSILRMKLNNLLLERLLRDLRKRCNSHIRLLSGANAELYEKRASLLLDKIAKLERRVPELDVVVTADVERHWIEGEVHALEMEFYQQKDYRACKGLWDKLREEETRLKVAIEKKKASSDSVPPAEGMRVPPIGFPVDIVASLPLATVDPDFIVLGFCALVLIGGTLYFWFKDDGRDDDGDSGSGGRVNKSGIAPVSGLKELVPSTPDGFGVRDVNCFDFYGLLINLYYGESGVGHESVVWASFDGEMHRKPVTEMQPIWCNTTKSVVGKSGVVVGKSGVGQPSVSICSFLRCAFLFVVAMVLCFCCLSKSPGKTSTLNKVKVNARPYILLALSYVTLTPLVDVSEIIARITKTFARLGSRSLFNYIQGVFPPNLEVFIPD